MRKFSILFLVFLIVSCTDISGIFQSEISIPEDDIVNPDDDLVEDVDSTTDENIGEPESPFQFGLLDSYCYGFSSPSEEFVITLDTDIVFPPSHDLSSLLPPVRSQGRQGSCTAWATGYYLRSFQENLEDVNNGATQNTNIMSPAYVFNQIKIIECSSAAISEALLLLKDSGIVSWGVMPYTENDCRDLPDDEMDALAATKKIVSYNALSAENLFEQAKAALLNNQPIVVAVSIDGTFFGVEEEDIFGNITSVYREFEEVNGAHAMLVVGYDDTMNAFKLVNSWGTTWGDNGFVWLDYKAFKEADDSESDFKVLCEAWIAEDLIDL